MLDIIKFNWIKTPCSRKTERRPCRQGIRRGFLLCIFALASCLFPAALYFGMLIPPALKTGDAITVPAVFAFATVHLQQGFQWDSIILYTCLRDKPAGTVMNKASDI